MISLPNRLRQQTFWQFHIAGWFLYAIFRLLVVLPLKGWTPSIFASVFLQVLAGFILTAVLRLYFRKVPYQEKTLRSIIILIFSGAAVTTIAWLGAYIVIEYLLFGDWIFSVIMKPLSLGTVLAFSFPDKLGWSALYFGLRFWRDWLGEHERTERALRLAQEAQVQAVCYRLNPEFLFPALDWVGRRIDSDAKEARTMITELAEFLRYSLISRHRSIVPLRDELDAVRLYLSIEREISGNKLMTHIETEPRCDAIPVPSLILHPIVEEATRQTTVGVREPLQVSVRAESSNGNVRISVEYPLVENGERSAGRILEEVEARLESLIPGRHTLELRDDHGMRTFIVGVRCPDGGTDD